MAQKEKSNQKSIISADDLNVVMKIVSKNWYYFLFLPAIAAVLSYFYTYRMADVYAAKTQILLKSDDTYDYQNQIYQRLGWYGMYGDITNQKRVLASHNLINDALSRLDFDVSYFIEGRFRTTEVFDQVPFEVEVQYLNDGLYEQPMNFRILSPDSFSIAYTKGEQEIKRKYAFNTLISEPEYLLQVNRLLTIAPNMLAHMKTINYQFKVHTMGHLIYKYKNALEINNIEYTSILELTVKDAISKRAKQFLDTLSAVYIEYTLQSQIDINANTLVYIQKQLDEVTNILDSIEQDLETYKSQRAILDLDREENEYFKQLVVYDTQRRQFLLKLQSIQNLENYITGINNVEEKLLPPSLYILDNDDYLKTAVNELYSMQMERNAMLFNSTEQNLGIEMQDQKIALLTQNILVYLTNSKKAINETIGNLQQQINDYRGLIRTVPKTQRDILNIERKLQVNEKLYIFLLEKRANTVIAAAGIIPQTKVIETARSVGRVGPNKNKSMYLFIGVAFAIAMIVAFIRHVFFERIENVKELSDLTNVTILGGIMRSEKAEGEYLVVTTQPKSNMAEAFRGVRTNLQYLNPSADKKVILVTSMHPGEGKTFCSSNIASIVAKSGKKVLLMDFDLHKPKVHKALTIENNEGISGVLIGKYEPSEVLKDTEIDTLKVLLCGPVPPNASELVLNDRVEQLFNWARTEFDFVVVDTPPLGLISDGLALLRRVDAGVFVMNTNHANPTGLKHIEEVIEKSNVPSAGLILNNVRQKRWRYYYGKYGYKYGYLYGYGYGYGYGQSYGSEEND